MTTTTENPTDKTLAKAKAIPMNLPVKSVNTFKSFMDQPAMKEMLKKALAKHLTYDRLMSMVTVALSRTPRLRDCTPLSLLQACLDAALKGCVSIGGPGARGYLIPYKNGRLSREARQDVYEAQFQSSYLGLCDMARRSGEIAFIDAFPVFESDRFEYSQGFESKLVHTPNPDPKAARTKAALRYVYAIARYRHHDLPQFRVLTLAEVEEHRARSRAANDGPWVTDYIAMAMKTAVRVLAKWLPQSEEMQEQEMKEASLDFVDSRVMDLPDLEATSGADGLADRLTGEAVDPETGEVVDADPATKDEAARQVEALRQAESPPAEAPETEGAEEAPESAGTLL